MCIKLLTVLAGMPALESSLRTRLNPRIIDGAARRLTARVDRLRQDVGGLQDHVLTLAGGVERPLGGSSAGALPATAYSVRGAIRSMLSRAHREGTSQVYLAFAGCALVVHRQDVRLMMPDTVGPHLHRSLSLGELSAARAQLSPESHLNVLIEPVESEKWLNEAQRSVYSTYPRKLTAPQILRASAFRPQRAMEYAAGLNVSDTSILGVIDQKLSPGRSSGPVRKGAEDVLSNP